MNYWMRSIHAKFGSFATSRTSLGEQDSKGNRGTARSRRADDRRRIKSMQDIVKGNWLLSMNEMGHHSIRQLRPSIFPTLSYRQFVLGKLVGSGALGKVIEHDCSLDGQVVAVKFMHRHLWTNLIVDSRSARDRPRIEDQPQRRCKVSRLGTVATWWPLSCLWYVDGQPLTHVKPNDSETSVHGIDGRSARPLQPHIKPERARRLNSQQHLLDHNGRIVVLPISVSQPTRKNQQQTMLHLSLSHHLVERLALPLPSRFHLPSARLALLPTSTRSAD